jgi:uncharacterized glyoxalase superfamily protein PhnB
MSPVAKDCTSTVIPCMRYRDALTMIDWLERAFGFVRHGVFMDGETTVAHAQMTFGNGMIMLSSAEKKSPYGNMIAQPDEIGGRETQTACLIVSDSEAIYATAQAAGAEMVMDLAEMDYGGKAFTCRDPEGHIWSIGEYDPWATPVE